MHESKFSKQRALFWDLQCSKISIAISVLLQNNVKMIGNNWNNVNVIIGIMLTL